MSDDEDSWSLDLSDVEDEFHPALFHPDFDRDFYFEILQANHFPSSQATTERPVDDVSEQPYSFITTETQPPAQRQQSPPPPQPSASIADMQIESYSTTSIADPLIVGDSPALDPQGSQTSFSAVPPHPTSSVQIEAYSTSNLADPLLERDGESKPTPLGSDPSEQRTEPAGVQITAYSSVDNPASSGGYAAPPSSVSIRYSPIRPTAGSIEVPYATPLPQEEAFDEPHRPSISAYDMIDVSASDAENPPPTQRGSTTPVVTAGEFMSRASDMVFASQTNYSPPTLPPAHHPTSTASTSSSSTSTATPLSIEVYSSTDFISSQQEQQPSASTSSSAPIEPAVVQQKPQKRRLRMPNVDWTFYFVYLLNRLSQCEDVEENVRLCRRLRGLAESFGNVARLLGKELINDRLQGRQGRIRSVDAGGIAGGEKFIVRNVFFKFARDQHGLYGGDRFSAHAANHELTGLMAIIRVKLRAGQPLANVHVPLMTHITHFGFRLTAMSLLPIGRGSLVYGSCDGGKTILNSVPAVSDAMTYLGRELHLEPHFAGHISANQKLMALCGDIEVHRSTPPPNSPLRLLSQQIYFVCDTARIFPPVRPIAAPGVLSPFLWRMFRPEFLSRNPEPLSSDVFTRWGFDNHPEHNGKAARATNHLFQLIRDYAADLASKALQEYRFPNQQSLVVDLHYHGINIRYLADLWLAFTAACDALLTTDQHRHTARELKHQILVELLARSFKAELRDALRSSTSSTNTEHTTSVVTAARSRYFNNDNDEEGPDRLPAVHRLWLKHAAGATVPPLTALTVDDIPSSERIIQRALELTGIYPVGAEQWRSRPVTKHPFVYDSYEALATVDLALTQADNRKTLLRASALYQASLTRFSGDPTAWHNFGIAQYLLGRAASIAGDNRSANTMFIAAEDAFARCRIFETASRINTVSLGNLYLYWTELLLLHEERETRLDFFDKAIHQFSSALALPADDRMPDWMIMDSHGLALKKYAAALHDQEAPAEQIETTYLAAVEKLEQTRALLTVPAADLPFEPSSNLALTHFEHARRLIGNNSEFERAADLLARALALYEAILVSNITRSARLKTLLNYSSTLSLTASVASSIEERRSVLEKAIEQYSEAAKLSPDDCLVPYNCGISLQQRARASDTTEEKFTFFIEALKCHFRAVHINVYRPSLNQIQSISRDMFQNGVSHLVVPLLNQERETPLAQVSPIFSSALHILLVEASIREYVGAGCEGDSWTRGLEHGRAGLFDLARSVLDPNLLESSNFLPSFATTSLSNRWAQFADVHADFSPPAFFEALLKICDEVGESTTGPELPYEIWRTLRQLTINGAFAVALVFDTSIRELTVKSRNPGVVYESAWTVSNLVAPQDNRQLILHSQMLLTQIEWLQTFEQPPIIRNLGRTFAMLSTEADFHAVIPTDMHPFVDALVQAALGSE